MTTTVSNENNQTSFWVKLHDCEREKSTDIRPLTLLNVRLTESQQKRATRRVA